MIILFFDYELSQIYSLNSVIIFKNQISTLPIIEKSIDENNRPNINRCCFKQMTRYNNND